MLLGKENIMYSARFYKKLQRVKSWQEAIGELITKHYGFKTVIDMGSGNCYYLNGCYNAGASVCGLEYSYETCKEFIPVQILKYIHQADLSKPINRGKFDCAMSYECGEHIAPEYSDIFVDNLCNASKTVIFSAAIEGQGGENHLCERPQSYWIDKFASRGYVYNTDDTKIVKDIFASQEPRTKYLNVMIRNVYVIRRK